jgi:fibronectin-binding autotransporter adhesin
MLKRTRTLLSRWFGRHGRSVDRQRQVVRRRKSFLEPLESRQLLATFHVSLAGDDTNDGSNLTPFRSIQAAIAAASSTVDGPDIIKVAGGVYNEVGVDQRFIIGHSSSPPAGLTDLQLLGGWDANFTNRNPALTPTDYTFTNSVNSATRYDIPVYHPNTTIDGFTFRSSDGTVRREADTLQVETTNVTFSNNIVYVGIRNGDSRPTGVVTSTLNNSIEGLHILDNRFIANYTGTLDTTSFAQGIFLNPTHSSGVTISGNRFEGNNFAAMITVSSVSGVTIDSNEFIRSGPSEFQAISVREPGSPPGVPISDITITNNVIDGGETGGGIQIGSSNSSPGSTLPLSDIEVSGNTISNTKYAILIGPGNSNQLNSITATITDNTFNNNVIDLVYTSLGPGGSTIINGASINLSSGTISASPTADQNFRLVRNGDNLELYDVTDPLLPGLLLAHPIDSTTTLTILGGDNFDNELIVDFSGGNPIPAGGLAFEGGVAGHDTLAITGGATTTVRHNFTDENSGNIELSGGLEGTITYSGLEPITDNLNAAHRVFDFTSALSETITVTTSPVVGFDNRIDSDVGGELVDFTNPTDSLEIITTNGGGADTVVINSISPGYRAATTITTDGDDDFALHTTLTLGSALTTGHFSILQANSVTLAGSIYTDASGSTAAGNITIGAPITLGAGVLMDTDFNSLGTDGNISISGTVDGPYELTFQAGAGNVTVNGAIGGTTPVTNLGVTAGNFNATSIGLANNGQLNVNTTGNSAITGVISGSAATVTKSGSGTLKLSGANTYSGTTTVNFGSIIVAHNSALGSTAAGTVVTSDGAWVSLANGVTVTGESIAITGRGDSAPGASFSGALQAAVGATATWNGPVILNSEARVGAGAGGTLILSGVIQDGSGNNLAVSGGQGTGKIIISGTSNTYTGATQIVRGTLALGASNALPTGTVLDVDSTTAQEHSRFDLNGFNQTVGRLQRSGAGGGAGGSEVTNSSATAATLTVNQSANSSYNGNITGALNLTKSGTGTLTLNNTQANTFVGTTEILDGTVVAGHPAAFGPASNRVNLRGSNVTLRLATDTSINSHDIGVSSDFGPYTIVSDRATSGPAVNHVLGTVLLGNNTLNFTRGTNVVGADPVVTISTVNLSAGSAGTGTLNPTTANLSIGNVSIGQNPNPKTLTLAGTSTGNVITGVIANGMHTLSLTKSNTSVWTLLGANTYSGGTTISGGTLQLGNGGQAGSLGAGPVTNNSTLVFNHSGSLTVANNITGTGLINHIGTGTTSLTGIHSAGGGTNVTGGTLAVNGSLTSNVVVTAPGTLHGSGTITGNVSGNGTFSPGNSPGTMVIVGDFTPAGTVNFEVNSPWTTAGTEFDRYVVTGAVDLSGATLTFTNVTDTSPPALLQTLRIIDNDAADSTIPAATPAEGDLVNIGSREFRIYYNGGDGNDVVLVDASQPSVVYVEDIDWNLLTPGTAIADADFSTGAAEPAIYGVNAFNNLQTAIAAVAAGGAVIVNGGTYTLTSDVTLNKSLTLLGPNRDNSPLNGGPTRTAEAIINGGAGVFTGSSGYSFQLAGGITSLTVDGFTFTNFDGNLFESSVVPVTNVNLHDNIFNANNGSLFYKFDTSVATDFDVVRNRFTNHSMTGANSALFHLGNIANSAFNDNEAANIADRELVNVYHALTNSTFNNNDLQNTAGLFGSFADVTGLQVSDNTIQNSTMPNGTAPIYIGTYNGYTVTGVEITSNGITGVSGGGIGIKIAAEGPNASSISDVLIDDNTISGTSAYGLTLDTTDNGNGTIDGVTVTNNTFVNNTDGPILADARPVGGANIVRNLTIDNNTFDQDASIFGASFYLVDMRNVGGTNSFSGNQYALHGALPGGTDAIQAMAVRGNQTGTWNIVGNDFDGGGVVHNNAPVVFVTAIAILSTDGNTGNIPASAVINISENVITGFEDGIVIRDGVNGVYGGLTTGTQVNVFNNDLSGNSLFALRSGPTGETVNASGNWWGVNTPAGVAAATTANVDFTPWLNSGSDTSGALGFQGDFSNLHVDDDSPQVGAAGLISEAINLLTATGTVQVHAGSYTESVSTAGKAVTVSLGPPASLVSLNGDLTLDSNDTLAFNIDGTVAGTGYDHLSVTGSVTLGGAALSISSSIVPAAGDSFTLISNDLADTVSSTFNGLPAGSSVVVGGVNKTIFYQGNDGNDVVLLPETPTVAYVSNTLFAGLSLGDFIADADDGTSGNQPAIFGYNAFSTMADAQTAITSNGTIIVNGGTYPEAVAGLGTQTIEITGPNAAQTVIFASLATSAGQNVIIEGSSTLTVGNASNTTIAGVISGSGSFTKTGTGTVTLTAANTYSGQTTIAQGTLSLNGGNNRLLTTTDIRFGANSELDVNATSQTIRNLFFENAVSGTTVITGSGSLISNPNQALTIGGNANGIYRAVDMSSLGNFTFNGATYTLNIGGESSSAGTATGILTLAANSIITASNFFVGHHLQPSSVQNVGIVHLGQNTTINANNISVGRDKSAGTLDFRTGLVSPSLTIRGSAGGVSTANLVISDNNSGLQDSSGTIDLITGVIGASHIDAMFGTVTIGRSSRNQANGYNSTGSLLIANGSVTANHIVIAETAAGGSPAMGKSATGTLSINGANVTATTITLAEQNGIIPANANLELNSGLLTFGTLQRGSSAGGGGNINFTWVDGSLSNLSGTDQTLDGVTPVSGLSEGITIDLSNTGNVSGTHQWNVTTSNVANVAGTVTLTGDGSLTKIGNGTLILGGTNTYTGTTIVNVGTLQVDGANMGAGAVNVNNSAVLAGNGSIAGPVNVNNTARLAPGGSPELLATGALSLASTSFFDVQIGGTTPVTQHDQVDVTGTVTLNNATLNLIQLGGFTVDSGVFQQFVIINNDSNDPVIGTFNGLPEGSPLIHPQLGTFYVSYAGGDGNDVVLYSTPTVNGTPGPDTLVLRRFNASELEYSLNGAPFVQVTAFLPFTFNGLGDTDLMLVDTSNGNPASASDVNFNGELLRIQRNTGGANDQADYNPSPVAGSGRVTLTMGGGIGDVNFTGTTNVDFVNMETVNVHTATIDDNLSVNDTNTITNGGTLPAGYSITPAAALQVAGANALVGVRNTDNIHVMTTTGAGNGNDSVTIAGGTGAHGIGDLAIVTGGGADSVTVSGPLTVGGQITISSQNIAVNATLTAGGANCVLLDAGIGAITTSGPGVDVVAQNLLALAATGINLDTTVTNISATNSGAGDVTIDESNGANVLDVANSGGAVTITSATGSLNVTTISASTSVTLTATAGNITDANGATSNISAPSLSATAATGIDLDTTIATLTSAAVTGAGDINISDTADGLAVTSAITFDGNITLNATGGTLALDTVTAGGTGRNIVVSTTTIGDVQVNNVTALDDHIQITAVGSVLEAGADPGADLTAATAEIVAGTGIGASGAVIEVDLVTLNSAVVTDTGGIYLHDTAGGLIVAEATTSDGSISLTATSGNLRLDDVTAGGAGNVTAMTDTSGNILVDSVTAFGNLITLNSIGNISESGGDGAPDLVAASATLSASTGIGTSADPLEIAATNLEGNGGTGGIYVANTGELTIGGIGPTVGVSASGGDIVVTSTGQLTVTENVTATGPNTDITLTAIDAATAGQDLTVNVGVLISSAQASVTLNAGDNATITGNISSGTTTTINIDFGDAESAGPTATPGDGGTLVITGTITTPNTPAGGAFLNGGNDYDTFTFNPQTTTAFYVDGDLPTGGTAGDVLQINVTGTVNPNLTVPGNATVFNGKAYDGPGSGYWTFDPNHREVRFKSIEDQQITGPYHLTYDNGVNPVGNLVIMLDGTPSPNENLQFRDVSVAGPILYELDLANVLSVRVLGGVGNDTVTIDDINGLPSFSGSVPAATGVGNNTLIGDNDGTPLPEFFFDAGGGVNTLHLNLTSPGTLQQWAIGTGTGPAGTNEGELQTTNSTTGLNVYVRNVDEINRTGIGANPGGLTVFGDQFANTISIQDNTVETRISSPGYPSFDFSGNNYSSLVVNGQAGNDLIDLISFGSGQNNNWPITFNGEADNDTLRVRSTSGNTNTVTLNGNAGNDTFQLYDGTTTAGTVDNIAGPVVVDGGDGNVANNTDTLQIIDNADLTADSVLVSAVDPALNGDYAVEGINGVAGNDVTFRNVDVLEYTGTQGNDLIDGQFVNTVVPHDLNMVTLNGWTGADQFLLFTSDQLGGTGAGVTPTGVPSGVGMIYLNGDAPGNPNGLDGNDIFGETPAGIVGTGIMNVGLVVDTDTRMIRPSATTGLTINGGEPTGIQPPAGDENGDRLNLDITALPNTNYVIVSTFLPGTVVATGIAPTNWSQIEDMNLVDQNKLTNVQMGDLFARTTPTQDLIQFSRNATPANPSQVRLRITATIANYSASNKTIVYAGGGNDTITQADLTIPAEFYGEDGDDNITGGIANDWLVGGMGNDHVRGSSGDNVLWGDNAPTIPFDPEPQNSPVGGDDVLSALDGDDVFYGGGGNDQVSAGGGSDYAHGGYGNDVFDGGAGDDRLYGGPGNDKLSGYMGNDLLVGNDGDDKLYGQDGNDVLFGGAGADLLDGGNGNDLLVSGSVSIEDSTWTAFASTATYSPATYSNSMDNDLALIALLTLWGTSNDYGTLGSSPSISHDGDNDDLFGGLGDDAFCWELPDVLDNPPGIDPPDFNAPSQGNDERFGPTS